MEQTRRIYFDHAATTPVDPRVLQAMLPVFEGIWGNPSSIYADGRRARQALDAARRDIAAALNARPNDIVFTSGGSESDNLAIRGAALASVRRGKHIITSAIEHHAVLHTVEQLEREGFEATYLPVDAEGFVSVEDLTRALRPDTTVVSIMYANNEVGTVEPIAELARATKAFDSHIVFHTDAVQAAGALDLNVEALGVDMLSLAAHKIYGPKGVGVLYVRPRTPFVGQLLGGSQERNRRAGTENVAGAVGMATALQLAETERDANTAHLTSLRDRLVTHLPPLVPGLRITGPNPTEPAKAGPDLRDRGGHTRNQSGPLRLPNSFSCCLEGVEGESVLIQLDMNGISASSGSACTTGSLEPSHVLTAMGVPEDIARSSLRITLGHENTMRDIETLLEKLPEAVEKLRALAPEITT